MTLKVPDMTFEDFEELILDGMSKKTDMTRDQLREKIPEGLSWCRPFLRCLFNELKELREKKKGVKHGI